MKMLTFQQAEKIIREVPGTDQTYRIFLQDILSSVLAEDIYADMDMPPFDKSAVDGFACRREDLSFPMKCVGSVHAGESGDYALAPGECIRIMTGAPVPSGAGCVIMLEDTTADPDGKIRFVADKTSGNICFRGEDVIKGNIILQKGTLIRPRQVPALAAMGCTRPLVFRKPSVGLLCTGSELTEPENTPQPGMIRNTNGAQVIAQCQELNLSADYYGILPDDPEILTQTLMKSTSLNQVTIITGGVSVGDFDFVPQIIRELGFEILFHGMKVKPGKRMLFATRGNHYVLGLPGNPVSVLVQFEMLVRPFLLRLMNCTQIPGFEKRILGEDYSLKNADRLSFIPGFTGPDGTIIPAEYHGSAHIFAYSYTDVIIKIPEGIKNLNKGDLIDVRPV